MLDINPETICFIIAKAHEFHAKEEVVITETPLSPGDDWALQILADHDDDPTLQELQAVIEDLEPDQQVQLVALMWLGRGDFDIEEWNTALAEARSNRNARTASYLLGTPLVADYLQEGLSLHGYSCDE